MSIFEAPKSEIEARYESIKKNANIILEAEKNHCKATFDELWTGTMADSQAVLDLFGTDAVNLFQYHSAWQTFLQTVDPSYQWLTPPYNVTINEDGTVTLTEKEISE